MRVLRISKSAHSSSGDRRGWVSEVPFTWVISTSGSLRIRMAANSASTARPSVYFRRNTWPFDWFVLWGMARLSTPWSRSRSIHAQSRSGSFESISENGRVGARDDSKMTLR